MDISNATPLATGLALGPGPGADPVLGIILKGTFAIPPETHGVARLAETQLPIAAADEHYGDDVEASVRIESDLVPFKRRADVVVVGTAHAPRQRPVDSVDVSLRIGGLTRTLRVFGDRYWDFSGVVGSRATITGPEPFVRMPLVYERAFGGIDGSGGSWCVENLVGTGFVDPDTGADAHGTPVPNIEDPARLVTSLRDRPFPAGFGFFGKGWQPRVAYIGSEEGMRNPDPVFGLPRDFSVDFYNAAHPYLQMDGYLSGYEDVELTNLTEDGYRAFRLPGRVPEIRVVFGQPAPDGTPTADEARGGRSGTRADVSEEAGRPEGNRPFDGPVSVHPALDTMVLLPDEEQFYLVWRGTVSLPAVEEAVELIERIQVSFAG